MDLETLEYDTASTNMLEFLFLSFIVPGYSLSYLVKCYNAPATATHELHGA